MKRSAKPKPIAVDVVFAVSLFGFAGLGIYSFGSSSANAAPPIDLKKPVGKHSPPLEPIPPHHTLVWNGRHWITK